MRKIKSSLALLTALAVPATAHAQAGGNGNGGSGGGNAHAAATAAPTVGGDTTSTRQAVAKRRISSTKSIARRCNRMPSNLASIHMGMQWNTHGVP